MPCFLHVCDKFAAHRRWYLLVFDIFDALVNRKLTAKSGDAAVRLEQFVCA